MSYLISKADLPEFVQFSVNTPDNLIDPYLKDAWLFDVRPVLLDSEQAALATYANLAVARRLTLADYATLPLEDQALLPAEDRAGVAAYQLHTALRGWFCLEAYRRLFTYHGFHVTPRGVEFFNDGGQPVPTAQRNEMKQDILDKRNHYRILFEKALRLYRGPIPAPTTCCGVRRVSRQSKGGLQIHSV